MSLLLHKLLASSSQAIRSNTSHIAKRHRQQRLPISKQLKILGLSTTLTLSHFYATFSSSSPLYAESTSKSSSLYRGASPAALRSPPTQLVFLSRFEERRDDWGSWFGYFREAGYDCYDLNIATANQKPGLDELTEELTQQIRLLALQKPPLVFAFHKKGSDEALHQVQSRDPRMSGLVIIVSSSDKAALEELSGINLDKMRIIVVDESQPKDGALQQVERWMIDQGLA